MSDKDKEQQFEANDAEPELLAEPLKKDAGAPDAEADAAKETIDQQAIDDDETAGEPSDAPPSAALSAKPRSNAVAWLALLLSVIGIAAIGYNISRDWLAEEETATDDAIARLENRLKGADESRDELAAQLAQLGSLDRNSAAEIDALRQELDERVRLLSSLPARMSTLESSVASLAGISQSSRDAWLVAEAEYYMQIANAQLQLANNPELAALALRLADERVVQMGNPALTDVRRALADELAALDVMEKPDIAGATMTLASLAQVVASLPLATEAGAARGKAAAGEQQEQSGLDRAWSSLKQGMSGLVRVTPPDQAKLSLLSPDAETFLRNNLALQLQSARLALLRGEQAVFEHSLDDTRALLSDYFDGDSAQVQSAQQTLLEIRGNVFTSSTPDISGSLQLLRQFRTLRESSQ